MFRSTNTEQKSETRNDSLADLTAMQPIWEKYREQLIYAELKNESDKFPLSPTEQGYRLAYQKLAGTFFNAFDTDTQNSAEEVYLVIAASNDYVRNGLSRSLFTLFEKQGLNLHPTMEKDHRAIYIKSEQAKQTLQKMMVRMLDIDMALALLVDNWKKYEAVSFNYNDDDCLIVSLDDKEIRQQLSQDIEKVFGLSIEFSNASTTLNKAHSTLLAHYLQSITDAHIQNQKLSDDSKKFKQAQKEKVLQVLATAREKFHHNITTNRIAPSEPRMG
jgi:hypothetical protein